MENLGLGFSEFLTGALSVAFGAVVAIGGLMEIAFALVVVAVVVAALLIKRSKANGSGSRPNDGGTPQPK